MKASAGTAAKARRSAPAPKAARPAVRATGKTSGKTAAKPVVKSRPKPSAKPTARPVAKAAAKPVAKPSLRAPAKKPAVAAPARAKAAAVAPVRRTEPESVTAPVLAKPAETRVKPVVVARVEPAPPATPPQAVSRPAPAPVAPPPPKAPAPAVAPRSPSGFAAPEQAVAPTPPTPHYHTGPVPRVMQRPMAAAETFVAGDHVVYPTHGVGKVERIAIEEIAGHKLELIHITFEENRMTLRVPVAKARTAGLRKLASRDLFDKALDVLRGRARIKRTMWSRRAQEYEAKINSGDPLAIAEVVRDLHRNAGQPDQSFSERQIYENAMDRLGAELAALDQTDKAAAAVKLAEFLKTV